ETAPAAATPATVPPSFQPAPARMPKQKSDGSKDPGKKPAGAGGRRPRQPRRPADQDSAMADAPPSSADQRAAQHIIEAMHACTCEPAIVQHPWMSDDTITRYPHSFEGLRNEQFLRHLSLAFGNGVRFLEETWDLPGAGEREVQT